MSWDYLPRAFLLNSSQDNILHRPGGTWDAAKGRIFRYSLGMLSLNPLFLYESQAHSYNQSPHVQYFSSTKKSPQSRRSWSRRQRELWRRCQGCRGFSCGSVPTMVNLGWLQSQPSAHMVPVWGSLASSIPGHGLKLLHGGRPATLDVIVPGKTCFETMRKSNV